MVEKSSRSPSRSKEEKTVTEVRSPVQIAIHQLRILSFLFVFVDCTLTLCVSLAPIARLFALLGFSTVVRVQEGLGALASKIAGSVADRKGVKEVGDQRVAFQAPAGQRDRSERQKRVLAWLFPKPS
jgi:hypothetical protein